MPCGAEEFPLQKKMIQNETLSNSGPAKMGKYSLRGIWERIRYTIKKKKSHLEKEI